MSSNINKDLFKKFVKTANPEAQVSYSEERAKAVKPVTSRRMIEEERDRMRFDMINRTQGVVLQENVVELPPPVNLKEMTKGLMKKYARVANPQEAAKLDEAVKKGMPVSPEWSASKPLPIDELKTVLKTFIEPFKQGIGGAYTIRTEPYLTGYRAKVEHKILNEDVEIQDILSITCQLNGHGHPSTAEFEVILFESAAKSQVVRRSYEEAIDLVNDFAEFASTVTRLL